MVRRRARVGGVGARAKGSPRRRCARTCADTHYRLEIPEDNVGIMRVSMFMPFFKELEAAGVQEHLRGIYGAALVAPRDGANVTLEFSIAPGTEVSKDFIRSVATLRRHAVACAFAGAMATVAGGKGAAGAPITIRLRQFEPIHILARPDRVSVIYALEFTDPTDRAIARIIAQEFAEAQRHVSNAPPMNFSDREPPMELRGRAIAKQTESFVGYLSFAVFPKHFETEAKKAVVLNQLVLFRNYLDYHIKAAKSYLHMRMRARVDNWMQVLNRAHPEDPFASKEAKTISGKTFTRKV